MDNILDFPLQFLHHTTFFLGEAEKQVWDRWRWIKIFLFKKLLYIIYNIFPEENKIFPNILESKYGDYQEQKRISLETGLGYSPLLRGNL